MQGIVISFFVSVAAGLVVWWATRHYEATHDEKAATDSFPEEPAFLLIDETENAGSDWRSLNRARLNARLKRIVFFAFTFYFLCVALAFPAIFHQGFFYSKVDLSKVEILGLFTDAVVSQSSVIVLAVACAGLLYVPLLSASDRIAASIFKRLYEYVASSEDLVFRLRMGVFTVMCVFMCGLSVFMFTDLGFAASMTAPVIAIAFDLMSAERGKQ